MFNVWWSELAAILVAILAFLGLLFLSLTYRIRKKQPDWPNSITLNTIMSILIVLLRAALGYVIAECLGQQKWLSFRQKDRSLIDLDNYDRATRGPVGSLLLLGHPSTWSLRPVAGILLMMLSVGIGPVSQQLISFENCLLSTTSGRRRYRSKRCI